MIIFIAYLLYIIQAQQQLLYLQDKEGFMIQTNSKYIDSSFIYQDDKLFHNQQIIQKIIDEELEDCKTLLSIKYDKHEVYLNIYILYLTYSDQYKYGSYQIILRSARQQNQLLALFIGCVQNILIQQTNLQCYSFYYQQQTKKLYIICKKHLQNVFQLLIYEQSNEIIHEFTLDEPNISKNQEYLLESIDNSLYLIAYKNEDILTYQIDQDETNIVVTFKFSFSQLCPYCSMLQFNKYYVGDKNLYFYNQQIFLQISVQGQQLISQNGTRQIQFMYEEEGFLYVVTDISVIKQQNRKVVKQFIQQTDQLEYQHFGKYRILSNNTHLVINNQYTLLQINGIKYIDSDMLLIFSENRLQLFQIQQLNDILFMDREVISITPAKLDLRNINYYDNPTQNIQQSQTYNVYTNETTVKFVFQDIPLLGLDIEQSQIALQVDSYKLKIPLNLQNITKKHSILMHQESDGFFNQIWIVYQNNTLSILQYRCSLLIQCNQSAESTQELNSYEQNYSIWVRQVEESSFKKNLIILIQYDNNNLFLYQFQCWKEFISLTGLPLKLNNLTIQSVAITEEYLVLQLNSGLYVYNSAGTLQNQLNISLNYSSILLMEKHRLLWLSQDGLILSKINDFMHLNVFPLQKSRYQKLLEFSNNFFVLIYNTHKTFLEHYYLSPENCIILLKQLPTLEYNIIYPFKIKTQLPSFFSIEAIDQNQNKRILLYDISFPSLYSLRHISKIKSEEYTIDNSGRLVFIHQEYFEVIQHDTLLVIQNNIDFKDKHQLTQIQKIQYKILKLQITISIRITYQDSKKQIYVYQKNLPITYDSQTQYYNLPIQHICKGNVEDIKLINNQYQIIKPFLTLFNENVTYKLIYQLNETHFLLYQERINGNYIIYSKLDISEKKNSLQFIEINSIENKSHQSYKWIYEVNVNQQRYIIFIIFLPWLEVHCHKIDTQIYSSTKVVLDWKAETQIKNILQLSQDKLLIETEANYIYLTIYQVQDEIQLNATQKEFSPQLYFYQNYKIAIQNYLITVSQYDSINFDYNSQFTVRYPYLEPNSTTFKIITIKYNFLIVLYEDNINELNFIQYNNGEYQYFSIVKPQLNLSVKSIQLLNDNIIMIEYISSRTKFANIYYIENLINHQKIYSLQQFILGNYQMYKIQNQYILFQSFYNISMVKVSNFYQLEIRNPKILNLDLLIYNSQDQEIVQLRIYLNLSNFYFMIIATFVLIQILFIQCKINEMKMYD